MISYDNYLKKCREECGSVNISGKEYVFIFDPKKTEIYDNFCQTVAICPTETECKFYPYDEEISIGTFLISWKAEPYQKEIDWSNPLQILIGRNKLIFDRNLELDEKFIASKKDRGLAVKSSEKTYILMHDDKKRSENYFYSTALCEGEMVYHEGHRHYSLYELRWNVGPNGANPDELGNPDNVINLHNTIFFSRNILKIIIDPLVSDEFKNELWREHFSIRPQKK